MAGSRGLLLLVVAAAVAGLAAGNFRDDCDIPWEPQNAWFSDDGTTPSRCSSPATTQVRFLISLRFHTRAD
jgi:hypothetical protein